MSDTLTRMRARGAVVTLAALLAGCGDDISLRIAVEHPTTSAVALTKVSVYESPNLRCQDIATARVSADDIETALVAEESTSASGERTGSLSDLSRVDHKVIVARGYDVNGEWITAGCSEQDAVDETTTITIKTKETVTTATVLDNDPADPFLTIIAATDITGRGIANRGVGWTVYGPAGSMPSDASNTTSLGDAMWEPNHSSCTEVSGAASLHPMPPAVVGGYSVQLRAEWAVTLPALYSRFVASFAGKTVTPPTGSTKYCALRRAGTTARLVCLDNNVARDFELTITGGQVNLVQRDMTAIGAEAMNLVSIPTAAGNRDVYVVTTRGLLQPLFGAPAADNTAAPCADGTCEIDDVLVAPACGAALPGKLLMHVRQMGPGQLKVMNLRGGGTQDFPTGTIMSTFVVELDNAGCVTRADANGGAPTMRQVVTYHVGTKNALNELVEISTRAAYNCSSGNCMTNELFPGAGVTFTSGTESRMLVTRVDASGVVVTEVVMAPDNAMRDLFVERARMPAAGVPDRIVVGQFDGDSDTDTLWNIGNRRGASFEVAYARSIGLDRLEALSAVQPIGVTALDAMDLSGDGHDDVMIVGEFAGGSSGVVVLPMYAPASIAPIPVDAPCK